MAAARRKGDQVVSTLNGQRHTTQPRGGVGTRTHHRGLGGWAALQRGTEEWRMTRWPGDGFPTSTFVDYFEAWGQTPAGEEASEQ